MNLHSIGDRLQKTELFDRISPLLIAAANKLTPAGPVEDALTGRWLGHPVHPPMTDVPIGTWTSALLIDLLGSDEQESAADLLVAAGVIASLPTAAAGLADWKYTDGGERRVGTIHGLMNVAVLATYSASLVARRRDHRRFGKALGSAGWLMVNVSSWLGGYLSFSTGVGMDETAHEKRPTDWAPILRSDELAEGESQRATVGEADILLVRRNDRVYALANTCSHRGGPLDEGDIGLDSVTCPWHASCFFLETGEVIRGPAAFPQPIYQTRVRGDMIEVRAN